MSYDIEGLKREIAALRFETSELEDGPVRDKKLEKLEKLQGILADELEAQIIEEQNKSAQINAVIEAFEKEKTAQSGGRTSSGHKGFAYYQKLRRKDPHAYYSARIQNEVAEARMALGQKFYEMEEK